MLSHCPGPSLFGRALVFWCVEPNRSGPRLMQGVHLRGAIMPDEPIKTLSRLPIWAAFMLGLGLVAVFVWMLFLGWLLGRAVLAVL
jgi:hypothetical protein